MENETIAILSVGALIGVGIKPTWRILVRMCTSPERRRERRRELEMRLKFLEADVAKLLKKAKLSSERDSSYLDMLANLRRFNLLRL
ncbi:hypothetical protein [Mesorhizobium sp. M1B.F.Ca.ET.045.04.1.1]|uniref:hypothetical protein n=1 Tax=Mesorhizobium sp. M1B.F.Ca.ET.045.04.1.1 TaxID=2493673 RepID=UPI000F75DCD0|nr:hypothetical protein [Mesorhizobium sp. M1B.F.Ca.ET.045.04.1.1]AZO29803.1 hypothetical protein EJ071_21970 [Mesorhizobium sp. M1B.F.Ca.ET.045.04.1.1]